MSKRHWNKREVVVYHKAYNQGLKEGKLRRKIVIDEIKKLLGDLK